MGLRHGGAGFVERPGSFNHMPKIALQQGRLPAITKEDDSLAPRDCWPGRNCPIFAASSPHFHQSVFAVSPQLVRAGIEAMIGSL